MGRLYRDLAPGTPTSGSPAASSASRQLRTAADRL